MHRTSSAVFFALIALWAAAPGCGSGGDDLFEGNGQGGQSDASVDTGQGGASGKGGATGTGGGTSHGGSATGGQAGAGQGGNPSSGGGAGEGGNPASGGNPGTGGWPGSGGMTATGGSSGAGGLATGCESLCDSSFCQGGTATSACLNCLNTTCKEIGDLYTYAPDLQSYQSCINSCTESTCYDSCCYENPKACWTGEMWSGCSCGWDETSCESVCGDACSGGFMQEDCQDCIKPSPCGLALYKYHNMPQAGEYSTCRNNCYGDVSCQQGCCNQYPQPCAARQAAVDCVCK